MMTVLLPSKYPENKVKSTPPHFLTIFESYLKALFFLILLLALGTNVWNNTASANDLKNNSSPYLALHGDDPVDWKEWGEPVLAQAKKENKLLFVSIGYFACHWCHVMQRESFSDKGIANKLNKNYISVKVDRELNPVLDKRLIEFVQVTNGTAGWPLNVFVTPDGYPLVGATYLPRESFSTVLTQLDKKWKSEQVELSKQAQEMSLTLKTMLEKQERTVSGNISDLADKYIETAMQEIDSLQGGFGNQLKFPQIPQIWGLLKLNRKKKSKEVDEFLHLTLKQMAEKGLHDELAGGFYRYTVDPSWEIPHFEKMLYTNALMALLYFDAADQYNNQAYRQTALETLYFLQNEMRGKSNAFIASLSAVDDKNEEGGFYLWDQSELKKVLSEGELDLANLYWNLNRPNELAAGNLPRQHTTAKALAENYGATEKDIKNNITYLKQKLKAHRDKTRVLPRDTKLLAGMNGLTLAAFARGVKHDKNLLASTHKLSQFLISLWDGKILRRSAANNTPGTLYDYAAVSWGLLNWGIASNDTKTIKIGKAIAATAWDRFYINKSWVENPDSLLPKANDQGHIADSALVSAEALLLEASKLTNDTALKQKANAVLANVTRSLETGVFSFPSLLSLSTTK